MGKAGESNHLRQFILHTVPEMMLAVICSSTYGGENVLCKLPFGMW